MSYLVFKSLHVAAVIAWMGGMVLSSVALIWLRRADCPRTERETAALSVIRQWDSRVTLPAMGLAWVLGVLIAVQGDWFSQPWLHAKLLLVLLLSGLHGNLQATMRRLHADPARTASGYLGYAGLFTLLSMLVIVLLVVIKPF